MQEKRGERPKKRYMIWKEEANRGKREGEERRGEEERRTAQSGRRRIAIQKQGGSSRRVCAMERGRGQDACSCPIQVEAKVAALVAVVVVGTRAFFMH